MKAQGGEQKVMKKILTVALSTAMAFSMFASVAFGDSATAVSPQEKFDALAAKGIFNGYPDKQAHLEKDMTRAEFAKVITKLLGLKEVTGTLSYKDKGYDAKNWAVPYIEAVTAAGIMDGQDPVKKIFNYNGKVTVQEMATVLTRALKLEVPAKTDNSATEWAKGYVQAAIDKGLIAKDLNFQANASRELLVNTAYTIDQLKNISVASYKIVDPSNVEFTLNTGEVVKVKLEKALEANKETEVTFKNAAGQEITTKITWVVESATKVESATSANLKEVDVAFDGKVEKASATDADNYSVNSGAKKVKSATLQQDGKTVRLLLADGSVFVQGTEYTVSVKNVKSSEGKVLSAQSVKFTSADNTLPTVSEVKALGNKAIKVTFSEPVKSVASSNFKLDDKTFVGNVTKGANEREVVLKDYSGNLALGAHKLTATLVEDYAGLKSLSSTTDFTVVEDKEAPKAVEFSATLEKVTVTFDEEIDPDSVNGESFYWKSGDTKKYGVAKAISGNTYEIDFTKNPLPGFETTLYINVKDYSGNGALTENKITATVDLIRPKVEDVVYGRDGNVLTVKFSKPVYGDVKNAYTIKNSDGDVIPVTSISVDSDNKVFRLSTLSNLTDGDYTLKVSGIQDRTALKNTMEDYSTSFKVDDVTRPTLVKKIDANNYTRTLVINFDKQMDLASLADHSNYVVNLTINGSAVTKTLPSEVTLRPILGGRAVQMVFPEYIQNDVLTDFAGANSNGKPSVNSIIVLGVKSAAGNILNGSYQPEAVSATTAKFVSAEQKDYRTIKLTFDQAVSQANASDFRIDGNVPSSVSIGTEGDTVTLTTSYDLPAGGSNVSIVTNNVKTYAGNIVTQDSKNTQNSVAPKVTNAVISFDQTSRIFTVPFNTTLSSANANLFAFDLVVKQDEDVNLPTLSAGVDYTTSWSPSGVVVTLKETDKVKNYKGTKYSVQVKDKAEYIKGLNGKVAQKSDAISVVGYSSNPQTTPVDFNTPGAMTNATNATKASAIVELVTTGAKETLALQAKTPGAAANSYALIVTEDPSLTAGTASVNLTDKIIAVKVHDTTVQTVAAELAKVKAINDLFDVTIDGTSTAVVDEFNSTVTKNGAEAKAATVTVVAKSEVGNFGAIALYTEADKSDNPVVVSSDNVKVGADKKTLTITLPSTVANNTSFAVAQLL
ncbi:Ig-like domain-containing protein [Paenibacillus dokdonensis]